MRTQLALAVLLGVSLLACGGSKDEAATTEDQSTSAPKTGGANETTEDATDPSSEGSDDADEAKSPASPGPASKGDEEPATPGDPPATPADPPVTPPGTPGDPPAQPPPTPAQQCAADSVMEVEGNETAETATAVELGKAFCGSLSSTTDVDHFTFVLPAGAKTIAWSASYGDGGKATLSFTSEGVTRASNEAPPFFPGKKYVVKLENPGAKVIDYAIKVSFTQ